MNNENGFERPLFTLDSGEEVDAANFAFFTTTGIDPDPDNVGLLVEHTCGNDLCMNPSHMRLPIRKE